MARPWTTSRSAPPVSSQVVGIFSFWWQSSPWASTPLGPQGVPKVLAECPPLKTQLLVKVWVAASHWQFIWAWLPRLWRAMFTMSTSTYWLKLPRKTVRPSWVASHAVDRVGAQVSRLPRSSPVPLLAVAHTLLMPGGTGRERDGFQASTRVRVWRGGVVVGAPPAGGGVA